MGYACDTQKAVPVGKNDKPPATQKEMVCRLLLKVSKEEYQGFKYESFYRGGISGRCSSWEAASRRAS